jgi:hypothetical protein
MERRKLGSLGWFLDFMKMELPAKGSVDYLWLSAEISRFIPPGWVLRKPDTKNDPLAFARWWSMVDLHDCQNEIKTLFETMLEKIQVLRTGKLLSAEKGLKELRPLIDSPLISYRESFGVALQVVGESPDEWRIGLIMTSPKGKDRLILHFIKHMIDLSLDDFLTCPECNQVFIRTGKRKKEFCSNKCAARFGMRRKRQSQTPEEKEEELRKNADRAHKSYVKTVPVGKPQRRPYKHK